MLYFCLLQDSPLCGLPFEARSNNVTSLHHLLANKMCFASSQRECVSGCGRRPYPQNTIHLYEKTVSKTHASLSHVIWTIGFNLAPKPVLIQWCLLQIGNFHCSDYTNVAAGVKVVTQRLPNSVNILHNAANRKEWKFNNVQEIGDWRSGIRRVSNLQSPISNLSFAGYLLFVPK